MQLTVIVLYRIQPPLTQRHTLMCINLASIKFSDFSDFDFPLNLVLQNVWLLDYMNPQIHKITKFCMH